MKKSSFVSLNLGTISCVFFALGMCMAMLPEWNAFRPGVIVGCVGLLFSFITVFVWRRMEHKTPVKITGKAVLTAVTGIIGALALGVGMCMVMVWSNLVIGIAVGMVGIILMLCLIPLCKGIREE
ncbi:hypothetical protein AALB39_22325 [Lachnospiraceae bacterium 54-53]